MILRRTTAKKDKRGKNHSVSPSVILAVRDLSELYSELGSNSSIKQEEEEEEEEEEEVEEEEELEWLKV